MALGAALQSAVGMGLALVVVPMLAMIDTALIPGPMLLASVGLCFGMAWSGRNAIDWKLLRPALLGLGLGTAVGAALLAAMPGSSLGKLFAVLILAAIAISMVGLHPPATRATCAIGGVASGIMGTMAGIHGPAIALMLQKEEPRRVRALLGAYFFLGYCISVAALWAVGVFTLTSAGLGLALIPGTALGFFLGPWLARFVDQRRLRIAILAISGVSALLLLLR